MSNTDLGKMKLENVLTDAIFLAPKVYYLETIDDKIIYKVKGLKHEVELNIHDFESLLYKDSFIKKFKTKWLKNLSDGCISVKNELYTLKITDNNRNLVFNEKGKLIDTKPYIIEKVQTIQNN